MDGAWNFKKREKRRVEEENKRRLFGQKGASRRGSFQQVPQKKRQNWLLLLLLPLYLKVGMRVRRPGKKGRERTPKAFETQQPSVCACAGEDPLRVLPQAFFSFFPHFHSFIPFFHSPLSKKTENVDQVCSIETSTTRIGFKWTKRNSNNNNCCGLSSPSRRPLCQNIVDWIQNTMHTGIKMGVVSMYKGCRLWSSNFGSGLQSWLVCFKKFPNH